MRNRWRKILVGAKALAGILLRGVGIAWLRKLMTVGQVPSEFLGRRVGFTIAALVAGVAAIIWCLVAGKAWAGDGPLRPSRALDR